MDGYLKELLRNNFKSKVMNITKISGGYLTEKWKLQLENNNSIMIKIIDEKKVARRNIDVELAYKLLNDANAYGIKCPKIFRINNKLVNYNELNKPIVITEYIENTFLKDYTNITKSEIHSLGKEISKMRLCFNSIKLNKQIDYNEMIEKIKEDYNRRVKLGILNNNEKYLKDVLKQKKIIDSLEISFLKELEVGYCHRDLSQDNILFDNSGLKAIVDFELSNVSFILIDIARVFLTFCLDNKGNINKMLLTELLKGYNIFNTITLEDLIKGIKILWFVEVGLWIKEEYYSNINPIKVEKFIYEINWITDNWNYLNEILKI